MQIEARLDAAVAPTDVKSYELWVLNQIGRDNNPIQCGELLSRTVTPASENVLKVVPNPIDGNFGSSTIAIKNIANGSQDRIFYIDLYDVPVGQVGQRIGSGCAASVSINGGKTTTVDIAIEAPEPPASR